MKTLSMSLLDVGNDGDVQSIFYCKKRKCFKKCIASFLRSKLEKIFTTAEQGGSLELLEMLGSGGKFYFDHRRVCTKFILRRSF